jgi:hypothetical protein
LAATFAVVLGIYVAGSLALLGAWIAKRDRASLAPAENAAIGAFAAALAFALPLSATDFLAAQGYSPIRGGGLALLVLVFAAARVTATGGGGAMIVQELVWAIAAAGFGFLALAFAFGSLADAEANVRLFGLLLSLVLFFRVAQNVREQRRARMRASLWRAVAEAPTDRLDAFLERVLATPELRGARLLEGADLADYDGAALGAAFADTSLVAAADAKARTGVAGEQLRVLLDACEATHAAMISKEPLRLLLVNLPRLGAGPDADLQMRVLAKLAGRAGHA